jgi:hypothetical protein
MDIDAWKLRERERQRKHDTFARLPRASREAAMALCRQRVSFNDEISIDELLLAHRALGGGR